MADPPTTPSGPPTTASAEYNLAQALDFQSAHRTLHSAIPNYFTAQQSTIRLINSLSADELAFLRSEVARLNEKAAFQEEETRRLKEQAKLAEEKARCWEEFGFSLKMKVWYLERLQEWVRGQGSTVGEVVKTAMIWCVGVRMFMGWRQCAMGV